jgi:hypothetical protein
MSSSEMTMVIDLGATRIEIDPDLARAAGITDVIFAETRFGRTTLKATPRGRWGPTGSSLVLQIEETSIPFQNVGPGRSEAEFDSAHVQAILVAQIA